MSNRILFLILLVFSVSCSDKKGENYSCLDDAAIDRIGVLLGSTQDAYVTEKFPNATIVRINASADLKLALKEDKCDVVLMDALIASVVYKDDPDVCILDKELYKGVIALGFNLENTALRDEFNKMLAEFRNDGTYDQIYDRWINQPHPVMPAFDMPKTGTPLRIAVSSTGAPYDYYENGENIGFDCELVRRFGQRLGRPVKFQIINFGGLLAAISSGKADIIAAGLTHTAERAKNVAFADAHNTVKTVSVILRKNLADTAEFIDTRYETKEDVSTKRIAVPGENMVSSEVSTMQSVENRGFFASIGDNFYNNLIAEKRYMLIIKGLWKTLIISLFAALFGTILGALVCFMRMSSKVILNSIAKTYITLMRGIPVLMLLMLLYYAVFAQWDISATIVAILAFALNFAAYVSEMFRTSIQGVGRGQSEAGIAMGFTKVQTFIFVIMPQAIKSVLPIYKGELISLVKMTSVVGYIAVEDLTKASDIIRSRTFDAFFPLIMVAVIYFLLAWGFAVALDSINKRVIRR